VGNKKETWQLHKLTNQLAHTHCPASMHVCAYR